jgi:hypothetical protein
MSALYRTTASIARRYSRVSAVAAAVTAAGLLGAAGFARKYSRVSAVAAAAAAAGLLGAAGFATGAAPWAQAVGNVAKTAQGDSPFASGQSGSFLFKAVSDFPARAGKPAAGPQADAIHAAATHDQPKHGQITAATADASQHAAKQPAKPQAAEPQAVRPQAAKPQPAKPQPAKPQAAKHQAVKPQAPAAPAKPYRLYDSVKPSTIPSGESAAVYVNGKYAASSGQVAGHHSVLWIDTNGSDPAADVLDVEPGDATPAGAAQWVQQRLSAHPNAVAIVYTMLNDWQQVKDDVGALPARMQSQVRYWIADPTGVSHIVPGANATQWYWGNNYDITTAYPNFQN